MFAIGHGHRAEGVRWQALLYAQEPKKKKYILMEKLAEMEDMTALSKLRIINCFHRSNLNDYSRDKEHRHN